MDNKDFGTRFLHREIDRVAGLLADGCSLETASFFNRTLWYLVDEAVSEAIELTHVDTSKMWLDEKKEHRAKMIDLINELSYYK